MVLKQPVWSYFRAEYGEKTVQKLNLRIDTIISDLVVERCKTQNVNDQLDETFELFVNNWSNNCNIWHHLCSIKSLSKDHACNGIFRIIDWMIWWERGNINWMTKRLIIVIWLISFVWVTIRRSNKSCFYVLSQNNFVAAKNSRQSRSWF